MGSSAAFLLHSLRRSAGDGSPVPREAKRLPYELLYGSICAIIPQIVGGGAYDAPQKARKDYAQNLICLPWKPFCQVTDAKLCKQIPGFARFYPIRTTCILL